MKRIAFIALAVSTLFSWISPAAAAADQVYELRIYTANEGKLEALLSRFRDHTCRLFEKHGIENIGYWVPVEKSEGADTTLLYLVAHASREAAKANWKAFGADPDWQAARQASEAAGKILARAPESIFLSPTDYSPPVKTGVNTPERTFELRTYTTPPGKLAALHQRFSQHTMTLFSKHGMSHIGYWVPMDDDKGAGTKLIYLLAHASHEAGLASFKSFRADPDWIQAKAASEAEGSLTMPQPEGVRSLYLKPLDFSPIR